MEYAKIIKFDLNKLHSKPKNNKDLETQTLAITKAISISINPIDIKETNLIRIVEKARHSIMSSRSHLYRVIDKYVTEHDIGAKQGSADWKEFKKSTCGGSEIAVFTGADHFKDIYQFIEAKVGIGKGFTGSMATMWGNLFEDVICRYVEEEFDTKIVATECFLRGVIPEQTYSPDGLGVINIERDYTLVKKGTRSAVRTEIVFPLLTNKIALFEFKCPFSRAIDGSIPEHYIPQVKTGLDSIKIAEIGVFVETVIRRCFLADLCFGNPYFDNKLKQAWPPQNAPMMPIALGFVGFYLGRPKPEFDSALKKLDEYYAGDNGMYAGETNDLTELPLEIFETLCSLFVGGVMKVWNSRIQHAEYMTNAEAMRNISRDIEEFRQFVADANCTIYGILPWKMLRVDYHFMEKETGYVMKYADKIREVIGVINSCHKETHHHKKLEIIARYKNKSLTIATDALNDAFDD